MLRPGSGASVPATFSRTFPPCGKKVSLAIDSLNWRSLLNRLIELTPLCADNHYISIMFRIILSVLLAVGILSLGALQPCISGDCASSHKAKTCAAHETLDVDTPETSPAVSSAAEPSCCCSPAIEASEPEIPDATDSLADSSADVCTCVTPVECPPALPMVFALGAQVFVTAPEATFLPEAAQPVYRAVSEQRRTDVSPLSSGSLNGFVRTVRLLC